MVFYFSIYFTIFKSEAHANAQEQYLHCEDPCKATIKFWGSISSLSGCSDFEKARLGL